MWGTAMRVTLLLSSLVCSSASVSAADADDVLALVEQYNDSSAATLTLPRPSDEQLERLVSGDVISFRNRTPMGDTGQMIFRVVALALVPEDRLRLWVATLGSVEQNASRLVEIKLRQEGGAAVWYQFVNLPWPVADRHWTIRSRARTDVAASTGVWWEHGWTLAAGGEQMAREVVDRNEAADLTMRQFERAVYLPANDGGWLMARADETMTLVAVHATAELGGGLPDSWVARYVARQLRAQIGKMRTRAGGAEAIVAASPQIFTGLGERVDPAMLADQDFSCRTNNRC